MLVQRKIIYAVLVLAVLGGLAAIFTEPLRRFFFKPTGSSVGQGKASGDDSKDIEVLAKELTVPWGVAFLPGGDLLVTERSGTLRRIGQDKQSHRINGVSHVGEGGLLGLALDPKFASNGRIYLYMTTRTDRPDRPAGGLTNRIERYKYSDDKLSDRLVILKDIPGEASHDGGRVAFGPDGYLYVATGDAGKTANAQDTSSLAGKILRLTADGQPAPGNPFGNAIYSYGHRNPQGLAWDDKGQLWSTEHGRSGQQSGYDELNLIRAGANYGWPEIQGDEYRPGMERPVAHSGPNETWAPGGLAYADGSLYFGGLRGQSLYQAKITGDKPVSLTAYFQKDYGRVRTTAVSGDYLYLTTSNTDGRGTPKDGDDKVVRMKLSVFK